MGDLHSSYFVILFENHELAKLEDHIWLYSSEMIRSNLISAQLFAKIWELVLDCWIKPKYNELQTAFKLIG